MRVPIGVLNASIDKPWPYIERMHSVSLASFVDHVTRQCCLLLASPADSTCKRIAIDLSVLHLDPVSVLCETALCSRVSTMTTSDSSSPTPPSPPAVFVTPKNWSRVNTKSFHFTVPSIQVLYGDASYLIPRSALLLSKSTALSRLGGPKNDDNLLHDPSIIQYEFDQAAKALGMEIPDGSWLDPVHPDTGEVYTFKSLRMHVSALTFDSTKDSAARKGVPARPLLAIRLAIRPIEPRSSLPARVTAPIVTPSPTTTRLPTVAPTNTFTEMPVEDPEPTNMTPVLPDPCESASDPPVRYEYRPSVEVDKLTEDDMAALARERGAIDPLVLAPETYYRAPSNAGRTPTVSRFHSSAGRALGTVAGRVADFLGSLSERRRSGPWRPEDDGLDEDELPNFHRGLFQHPVPSPIPSLAPPFMSTTPQRSNVSAAQPAPFWLPSSSFHPGSSPPVSHRPPRDNSTPPHYPRGPSPPAPSPPDSTTSSGSYAPCYVGDWRQHNLAPGDAVPRYWYGLLPHEDQYQAVFPVPLCNTLWDCDYILRLVCHRHAQFFVRKGAQSLEKSTFKEFITTCPSILPGQGLLEYLYAFASYCHEHGVWCPPLHTITSASPAGEWFTLLPNHVTMWYPKFASFISNALTLRLKSDLKDSHYAHCLLRHDGYQILQGFCQALRSPRMVRDVVQITPPTMGSDSFATYRIRLTKFLYENFFRGIILSDQYFVELFVRGLWESLRNAVGLTIESQVRLYLCGNRGHPLPGMYTFPWIFDYAIGLLAGRELKLLDGSAAVASSRRIQSILAAESTMSAAPAASAPTLDPMSIESLETALTRTIDAVGRDTVRCWLCDAPHQLASCPIFARFSADKQQQLRAILSPTRRVSWVDADTHSPNHLLDLSELNDSDFPPDSQT